MIRSTRCSAFAFVAAILSFGVVARADGPDPTAVALFRKGRDLVAQGDWTQGCEKLAESFRRHESASTLLNLARCDEHQGKIASAWARHEQAIPLAARLGDRARAAELEALAREGAAALAPRLPRLHVVVTDAPPGATLADASGRSLPLGEPVPMDPGTYRLVVRAPSRRPATFDVALTPGQVTALSVSLVEERPPVEARAPLLPAPPPPPSEGPKARWPVGVVAAGAGVVLGAVAVGFGVDAANANGTLHDRCGADLVCGEDPAFDPASLNARKNRGLALGIGFGAASLAAFGLATFVLLRGDDGEPRLRAFVRPDGAGLVGRF